MKKLLFLCKILLIGVIVIKVAALAGVIKETESWKASLSPDDAVADERAADDDQSSRHRELLKMLAEKEQELAEREKTLTDEEQRLSSLKQEILSRIDVLDSMMESIRVIDDKQYTDLAKVYEAAPPDRAGAMLERLNRKTAAAIIMRMKSKSAGEIWGYLDPDTAAAITREISDFLHYSTDVN
ncbi:MAG: hypothetical protein AVO39_07910 [delta proteobacterium MLS_D]|nr:MAG: hypothetical protein AVO39_07910 [delta proteobacterium MLS_D]